jgi:hypothetical protein
MAGVDAASASDAVFMVDLDDVARSVEAVFYRACLDAGMTIFAFGIVDSDNGRKIPRHSDPPIFFSMLLISSIFGEIQTQCIALFQLEQRNKTHKRVNS